MGVAFEIGGKITSPSRQKKVHVSQGISGLAKVVAGSCSSDGHGKTSWSLETRLHASKNSNAFEVSLGQGGMREGEKILRTILAARKELSKSEFRYSEIEGQLTWQENNESPSSSSSRTQTGIFRREHMSTDFVTCCIFFVLLLPTCLTNVQPTSRLQRKFSCSISQYLA
jgi:hypothetical protein